MAATLADPAAVAPAAGEGIAAQDFEEIVRQNQRRIYRLLLVLLRDPDAADTLTQECFLRAYKKRSGFRGDSSLATWLTHIAINLARDRQRSRRHAFWRKLFSGTADDSLADIAERLPALASSPEQALLAREELEAVWRSVDCLSPQQREVFLLRFVEEMRLEEISRALHLELGTVKSHLARALHAVRGFLQEYHGESTSERH